VEVDGTYDDVNRLCAELADAYRWAIVNVNLRPFYSEGSKTLAFEVVEQLGWRPPDHIVVPVAAGSLLAKTAKAFSELIGAGLVDQVSTRIHAAQAEGCAPVSRAIQLGQDRLSPIKPNSLAKSLAIGNPADGRYAARAVRASGGWGTVCHEDTIQESMALLAETEGILTEPAGGVVVAGLRELVLSGRIKRDESVVICITGNGLKTTELFNGENRRIRLTHARSEDFEQVFSGISFPLRGRVGVGAS
jgi:threonine synthase